MRQDDAGPKKREFRDTRKEEIDQYRRLAERYERNGQPAMATLLRNVVYLAEGGDMTDFAWALDHSRADGKLDDVEVKRP
jgi:hypothetical protein